MMSPLEYLFVMMMKTKPDADAMTAVEPASGEVIDASRNLTVTKAGSLEMRTILMEPQNTLSEKLEVPLRITEQWEPLFKIGGPVTIRMDKTGQTYDARISRIETIRDQGGQTVQAIAEMTHNDPILQPGLTATAMMRVSSLNN